MSVDDRGCRSAHDEMDVLEVTAAMAAGYWRLCSMPLPQAREATVAPAPRRAVREDAELRQTGACSQRCRCVVG